MILESRAHLIYEMKKVKEAIAKKDSDSMQTYYDALLSQLKIPSKEIIHNGFITLCSEKYSYHLLSCYLLLDVIEYFWNGANLFYERDLPGNYSLLEDLGIEEKGELFGIRSLSSPLSQVQGLLNEKLYVFIVPYEFKRDFSIKIAYPGNVLILYSNPGNNIEETFYEGIGTFYLKKKLKGKLPKWAVSEKKFIEQFKLWCDDEPSLFIKRKG